MQIITNMAGIDSLDVIQPLEREDCILQHRTQSTVDYSVIAVTDIVLETKMVLRLYGCNINWPHGPTVYEIHIYLLHILTNRCYLR